MYTETRERTSNDWIEGDPYCGAYSETRERVSSDWLEPYSNYGLGYYNPSYHYYPAPGYGRRYVSTFSEAATNLLVGCAVLGIFTLIAMTSRRNCYHEKVCHPIGHGLRNCHMERVCR
jgi:hypothetical protein